MVTGDENYPNNLPPSADSVGFGEGHAAKPKWDKKGKKNLIIVGAILIIALIAMLAMLLSGDEQEERVTPSYIPDVARPNEAANISQEDRTAIQAAEFKRIEHSRLAGGSAIAVPVEENPFVPYNEPKQQVPAIHAQPIPMSSEGIVPSAPQADHERMRELEKQMMAQMAAWGMEATSMETNRSYIRAASTSQRLPQNEGQNQSGRQNQRQTFDKVIVPAFEETYTAEMISTFDSDVSKKVRARVLTGPLEGMVLYGDAMMLADGAQMIFNQGSYKGVSMRISAHAVDENNATDIVDGQYNGRYATRFVFPVITKGISAYTAARAQTGTQVIVVNTPTADGGTTQTGAQQIPTPSAEQARNAMISAGADQVGRAVESLPNRAQVIVPSKQTFGLTFLEPIHESDLMGKQGQ